jgi:hypothetical protein
VLLLKSSAWRYALSHECRGIRFGVFVFHAAGAAFLLPRSRKHMYND